MTYNDIQKKYYLFDYILENPIVSILKLVLWYFL